MRPDGKCASYPGDLSASIAPRIALRSALDSKVNGRFLLAVAQTPTMRGAAGRYSRAALSRWVTNRGAGVGRKLPGEDPGHDTRGIAACPCGRDGARTCRDADSRGPRYARLRLRDLRPGTEARYLQPAIPHAAWLSGGAVPARHRHHRVLPFQRAARRLRRGRRRSTGDFAARSHPRARSARNRVRVRRRTDTERQVHAHRPRRARADLLRHHRAQAGRARGRAHGGAATGCPRQHARRPCLHRRQSRHRRLQRPFRRDLRRAARVAATRAAPIRRFCAIWPGTAITEPATSTPWSRNASRACAIRPVRRSRTALPTAAGTRSAGAAPRRAAR